MLELVLVFVLGGVPFIKAGGGDHAALEGDTAAKHRLFRHRFGAGINEIVSDHPECSETTITYDYEDGHTWASYWPEVLAIFAVHTNLNSDSDVVVINAAQMQRIQDTFWAMHEITYEIEEVDTTPEPTEDDPDPEQQTEYILHITVNSKTVDELAELYNFTSYGNQVLLDNGAGLSTRYAHMTQTAVTAGEAVTAGQVIGYVGNTGDSTGFHLHFEVMQNGVRVNPMDMVSVR